MRIMNMLLFFFCGEFFEYFHVSGFKRNVDEWCTMVCCKSEWWVHIRHIKDFCKYFMWHYISHLLQWKWHDIYICFKCLVFELKTLLFLVKIKKKILNLKFACILLFLFNFWLFVYRCRFLGVDLMADDYYDA